MLMFFYPAIMLGVIFVHKIFMVMAVANHLLILHALKRFIFFPVIVVMPVRLFFVNDDFIRMIRIITTIGGWKRCGMFPI